MHVEDDPAHCDTTDIGLPRHHASRAMRPRLPRRSFLRGAGIISVGASVTLSAPALAAPNPLPTRGSGRITLVFAPWHGGAEYNSLLTHLLRQAIEPFLQSNPGIDVVLSPASESASGFISAALAGQAPDVSSQYQLGQLSAGNAALDLQPYISQYNIDFSIWNEIAQAYVRPNGIFGLPDFTNMYGMIVNLTALDDMGLRHPAANWSYVDAARLFAAGTVKGKKSPHAGGAVQCNHVGSGMPSAYYLDGFGGGYVDPINLSRCTLDKPESIAAGEYVFGMLMSAEATNSTSCFRQNLVQGNTIIDVFGTCAMPQIAAMHGFQWDFWPMPALPKGPYTNAGPGVMIIAQNTKHPNEAFALLHWLTVEPYWQRWRMRTLLGGPVLNSLWPEYADILQRVAPVFRGKNLTVLGALSNNIHVRRYFAYDNPQAAAIMSTWSAKIVKRQVSVHDAFRQMTQLINAVESSAAGTAHAQQQVALELAAAHASKTAVTFPAPAVQSPGGSAVQQAPKNTVSSKSGVYTMVATGNGGAFGQGNMQLTFAGTSWNSSVGTFTCRLVSMAGPSGMAGLMARGDLDGGAPEVTIGAKIGGGLHLWSRPMPLLRMSDQRALIAASALFTSAAKPTNYLLRPLWLRLVRTAGSWTALTASDGIHWEVQGTSVGVETLGVWVGLFATPRAAGKTTVIFDNLSFTPTATYQVNG